MGNRIIHDFSMYDFPELGGRGVNDFSMYDFSKLGRGANDFSRYDFPEFSRKHDDFADVSTTYRNLVHSSNCAIFRVLQSVGEFWTLSNFRAGIDLHLENCSMQFFLLEGEYVGVGVLPLMN